MLRLVLLLGAALAMVAPAAQAQPAKPFYLPDGFEERPWEEQKALLPPYPDQRNLIAFDLGVASDFRFFVDSASLSVGRDEVVRFVLVALSPSGAANVSFEGLRCKTREKKLYAVGRADKSWVEARRVEWQRFRNDDRHPYAAVLAQDYFCPARGVVRNADEALDALRRKGHPAAATPL